MINSLSTKTMRVRNIFLAGLFGLIFVFHTGTGQARSLKSSASIIGQWSGGGVVISSDGGRERTRCHSSIRSSGARRYSVFARCAIASLGTVDQRGIIRKIGRNSYRGRFRNDQYDVSGIITIRLQGNRQFVTLRSAKGNGHLVLRRR